VQSLQRSLLIGGASGVQVLGSAAVEQRSVRPETADRLSRWLPAPRPSFTLGVMSGVSDDEASVEEG